MAFEEFECIEFEFDGLPAKVVKPNVEPNGKWALKTEYFAAFPEVEIELLNRGWHIAYNKNHHRWAEDFDLQRKKNFIDYVSSEFKLNSKCAIVGMSCGGMYGVKLAAICPEKISVMYLDAPVMNLLSCPANLGVGEVSLFEEYYNVTGRTISDMLSYREHPIDKMHILLENNIPVILVAGDSDRTVPYCENGALLEKYYKENGGTIEVHLKKNADHHPHGLENCDVIADFIENHS